MYTETVLKALCKFYWKADEKDFRRVFGPITGRHLWRKGMKDRLGEFLSDLDKPNFLLLIKEIERIGSGLWKLNGTADSYHR